MSRADLLQELTRLHAGDPDHLPVVPLDMYFEGNEEEDSIAPNQCGFGRPPLADVYRRFQEIAGRSDVQGVYVGLHEEWTEALECEDLWPAAENVHIFTSAGADEVEGWVEGLACDGAGEGWFYGKHALAPEPADGFRVITVYWD